MFDYRLKFDSAEQAKSVLYRREGVVEANKELGTEANEGYEVPNYEMIDIIGAIYKPTGKYKTIDGIQTPVFADVGGYHVNIRSTKDCPELEQFSVTVETPYRKWAGD